MSVWDKPRTV